MSTVKSLLLVVLLFFSQVFFSQQTKKITNKAVEKTLTDAGFALLDLNVDKSLKLSKTALSQAHELDNDALIAKAYNIIGLNLEEFYEISKGIEYYKKALHHAELAKNDSIKCWVNNNLGSVYTYRNINYDLGIKHYKEALIFAERIKDSVEIMFTKLNISGAYFGNNNFSNGIQYLKSIDKFVHKNGDLEALISLNTQYASYYDYLNQDEKAEQYFIQSIAIGQKNKDELIKASLIDVYKDFSDFYKKRKKFESAYYYIDIHEKLQKEIYNSERLKIVKLEGSQIEIDEYKREIDKIELEKDSKIKQSKIILTLSIVIFSVLLMFLYSLYKNYKLRTKSNQELEKANAELKNAIKVAEEASKLKSQFISTISHELRTPLYGVVGITNILVDEHKELAQSPHVNSLKFSARYLLSLVNDILQINKIEENRVVLEKLIFNVADEVTTIANSLEFIAKQNNNKIVTDIDVTIPESLIGDKLRLSQIFMNLVGNSLKFTRNGEIKIIAKLEKTLGTICYVKFEVIDNGVGIAKENQEKIFDKFVQLERKEGDYQGTGLGLSIVKKLIGVFDSEIYLESELNKGTSIHFTIAFETDTKLKNEIINNIEVDLSKNYAYSILVVEDNKINQIVTKKILDGYNFYTEILDDGYAAINRLENKSFDLILMDINMPIINGFETTKRIREKGIATPIVALTAFDKQEITEQCLSVGINDILVKPFEPQKLFQILDNTLKNNKL